MGCRVFWGEFEKLGELVKKVMFGVGVDRFGREVWGRVGDVDMDCWGRSG